MTIPENSALVWSTVIDKKYHCRVWRNEHNVYHGRYIITDIETGKVWYDKPTSLAYGSVFGPDVSDVVEWEEIAIEVVDEWVPAGRID